MHDAERDKEALRLVTAFYDVKDPETRTLLVTIIEAAARGADVKIQMVSDSETAHL